MPFWYWIDVGFYFLFRRLLFYKEGGGGESQQSKSDGKFPINPIILYKKQYYAFEFVTNFPGEYAQEARIFLD